MGGILTLGYCLRPIGHCFPIDCYLSWITSDFYLGWKPKLTIHIQNTFCMTRGLLTWTHDSKLPRGNHCPGLSVTLHSHDDLLSQGNTRGHFTFICMGVTGLENWPIHRLKLAQKQTHSQTTCNRNWLSYCRFYSI